MLSWFKLSGKGHMEAGQGFAEFLRWKSSVCGEELDASERATVLSHLPPIPKKRPRPKAFAMASKGTSSGSGDTMPKPPQPPPASAAHAKDFVKVLPPPPAPPARAKPAWLPTPPPPPVRSDAYVDIAAGAFAEAMHALQEAEFVTTEQQEVKTEQLRGHDDACQQVGDGEACQQVEKKMKLEEHCKSEPPLAADAYSGFEVWPEEWLSDME